MVNGFEYFKPGIGSNPLSPYISKNASGVQPKSDLNHPTPSATVNMTKSQPDPKYKGVSGSSVSGGASGVQPQSDLNHPTPSATVNMTKSQPKPASQGGIIRVSSDNNLGLSTAFPEKYSNTGMTKSQPKPASQGGIIRVSSDNNLGFSTAFPEKYSNKVVSLEKKQQPEKFRLPTFTDQPTGEKIDLSTIPKDTPESLRAYYAQGGIGAETYTPSTKEQLEKLRVFNEKKASDAQSAANLTLGAGMVAGATLALPVVVAASGPVAAGGALVLLGTQAVGGVIASKELGYMFAKSDFGGIKDVSKGRQVTVKEREEVTRIVEGQISEKLGKSGFVIPFVNVSTDQLLYGLPGSKIVSNIVQPLKGEPTAMSEFEGLTKKELLARGYSEAEATAQSKVVSSSNFGGDVGSVASLFPGGAIGEFGVRNAMVTASSKVGVMTEAEAAKYAGKTAFWSALAPGALEGATLYTTGSIAREQPVTVEGIAWTGGVSALTAGLGANWIARKSITNPNLASAVYKGVSVVQPDEPAGDFFTDLIMRGAGKQDKAIFKILTPTITPSIVPSVSSSSGSVVTGKLPQSMAVFTPTNAPSASNTFTKSDTSSDTPSQSNTFTGTQTPSDTFSDVFNQSQTAANTPSNVFNQSQTATNTYSNTFTNTFTYTPAVSYTGNLPFFPIGRLGGGGQEATGVLGATGRTRTKFYDELATAISSTKGFLSPVSFYKINNYKKKKIKAKNSYTFKWPNISFGKRMVFRHAPFF